MPVVISKRNLMEDQKFAVILCTTDLNLLTYMPK